MIQHGSTQCNYTSPCEFVSLSSIFCTKQSRLHAFSSNPSRCGDRENRLRVNMGQYNATIQWSLRSQLIHHSSWREQIEHRLSTQCSSNQSMLHAFSTIPLAPEDSCENTERGKQVMKEHGSTQYKINEPCEFVGRSQSIQYLYLQSSDNSTKQSMLRAFSSNPSSLREQRKENRL